MTLFRILAGIAVVSVLGGLLSDVRRRGGWRGMVRFVLDQSRTASQLWRERKTLGAGALFDNFRRISYGLTGVLFLLLALTGFLPVLLFGEHLSGLLLIIHVTVAPLFALGLSAVALLWAHRLRFDDLDWQFVLNPDERRRSGWDQRVRMTLKIGFWLVLVVSLPLMGTIILGLFPLFGTEGETILTRAHGYSAILFLAAALIEIYLTIVFVQRTNEQSPKEKAL